MASSAPLFTQGLNLVLACPLAGTRRTAMAMAIAVTTAICGAGWADMPDSGNAASAEKNLSNAGGTLSAGSSPDKGFPQCSIISQQPLSPTGAWNASTSETSPGYLGYEYYWGGPTTITDIRWWGINGMSMTSYGKTFYPCYRVPDTFKITFYRDNGGQPGEVVNFFTGTPIKTATGAIYGTFPLYQYDASLNPPISLESGWVSIEGTGDSDCWFLWMQSNEGDQYALHWEQTSSVTLNADFSLCLTGDLGGDGEGLPDGEGFPEGEGQGTDPLNIIQEVLGGGYNPGGYADVRVTFEYSDSDSVTALAFAQYLPIGWAFDSVLGGSYPAYQADPGQQGLIEFIWYNVPHLPYSITYRLRVPAGASGEYALTGNAVYFTRSSIFEHWANTASIQFGQANAAPANNNFANRANIQNTTQTELQGNNTGANKESGEPNHAGAIGGASVWWSWTAPNWASSAYTAMFSTKGSTFDTVLAVYRGTAVNALTQVAASDDAFDDYTSQVLFTPEPNVTYAIAVDGYQAAEGQITLTFSLFTGAPEGEGEPSEGEGQAEDLCPGSLLPDPGFEDGNAGFWYEYNDNGYSVLTYDEGGQRPYAGLWFAWLGGVRDVADVSGVEQEFLIPPAQSANVRFYLAIPARSENGVDAMKVYMDDDLLFTVLENNEAYLRRYAAVDLNVTPYANGQRHVLRFESTTTGQPTHTSFFVDEVCVTVQGGGQALTLNVYSQGPGTVYFQPAQTQYAFGDWVLLYPVPDDAARFDGWQGADWVVQDQGYSEYYWLLMTQNASITGIFNAVTVEGEGEGGGDGEGEGQHNEGDVYGTVRDAATNSPLAGVQIQLSNNATSASLDTATTDANGKYMVTTPDVGVALKLSLTKQGYQRRDIIGIYAPIEVNVNLQAQTLQAPTGLAAVAGPDQITLNWDPSTQVNLSGFNVYRAVGEGAFAKLNDTLVKTTGYVDPNIETRTRYRYRVTASDGNTESPPSNEVEVNADTLVMWMPQASGSMGDVIRVPLNVVNAGGLNPNGIDIVFLYPVEMLGSFPAGEEPANGDKVKVEQTVLTQQLSPLINAQTPGRVVITATGKSENLKGEGHLFDVLIPLKTGLQANTCQLMEFDYAKFYDGSVPPQRIPVTYAPKSAFLCLNPECALGDVNGDGDIDSGDVLLMLQLAVKLLDTNSCQQWAGDLNGDRRSDSADAVLIQRMAAELPLNPPVDKDGAAKTLMQLLGNQKQEVSISLGSVSAAQGGTINVPITLANAPGLGGADILVTFNPDPSQLTLQSVALGDAAAQFHFDKNAGNGFVRIAMTKDFAKSGAEEDPYAKASGTLATLTFKVAATATSGADLPLKFGEVKLRGEYGDSFDWYKTITRTDGKISVNANTLSLNVTTQGQGSVSLSPPGGSYTSGAQVRLTATPSSEWTFDHWSGGLSGSQNPATVTMTGNTSVTAVFTQVVPVQYTLTISVQGNGTTDPAAGTASYNAGTQIQVSATPASGWRFDHWEGAAAGGENPIVLTINANQSITAVFVEEEKQNAFLWCHGGPPSSGVSWGDAAVAGLLAVGLWFYPRRQPAEKRV